MKKYSIGIDLGGTHIKCVVMNESGHLMEKHTMTTEDNKESNPRWKEKINDYIQTIIIKYEGNITCGIAAPGLAAKDHLSIAFMPGRMSGLEQLNWTELIKLPTNILNDAQAACLAEWQMGAAKDTTHMLMITLGTGVGGAAIVDGKLYHGSNGRAGHFGHMTIDHRAAINTTQTPGSLEQAIGNLSVERRTHGTFHSTYALLEAYRNGDIKATYWWLDSVHQLACALSSLINAYDPQIIVIGGGIAKADDLLFIPLNEFMPLYEWPIDNKNVTIKKAELDEYAGAIGAALFSQSQNDKNHGTNN